MRLTLCFVLLVTVFAYGVPITSRQNRLLHQLHAVLNDTANINGDSINHPTLSSNNIQKANRQTNQDTEWKLVWQDDFTSSHLNSSFWNIKHNESHCCPEELQLYTQNNVFIENGNLVLETRRENVTGPKGKLFHFTSGWIDTEHKISLKYGKWEIRAKLPPQSATGAWPAHWLLPEPDTSQPPDVCWPVGGEIDIMEGCSMQFLYAIYGSYRWGTQCGDNKQVLPGSIYPPLGSSPVDFSKDFHVYSVEWNSTTLLFAFDGFVYHVRTSEQADIPQDPFYFIADTAVAWFWPPEQSAQYPARHIIDYVRVYQKSL